MEIKSNFKSSLSDYTTGTIIFFYLLLEKKVENHIENPVKTIKHFLTVPYFVAITSTSPCCAYTNILSSHYNWIFKTNYCVNYIDWIGLDIQT